MTLFSPWILFAFIGSHSVAGISAEDALRLNPAALFDLRGWSAKVGVDTSGVSQGQVVYHLGSIAMGYTRDRSWLFGASVRLRTGLRLGISVKKGSDSQSWSPVYGLLYRTRSWALGLTTNRWDRDATIRAGLAIRPFSRLFLSADGVFARESDPTIQLSAGLRIARGLWVQGSAQGTPERIDQVSVGLDLSLGHLRMGINQKLKSRKTTVGLILTPDRYPTALPMRHYLRIELHGNLSEDRTEGYLSSKPAFTDLLLAIQRASRDPAIRGIFVNLVQNGLPFSQTEELRTALENARKAGKRVILYGESLSLKDLYLASAADQVILAPTGNLFIPGLTIRRLYFTGLLEKLGINAEFERFAEYKSAVEPLTRKKMSPEDREQLRTYLQDLSQEVALRIRKGRDIDSTLFESLMDTLVYLEAEDAKRLGLVDTVLAPHRIPTHLKSQWGKARPWTWKHYIRSRGLDPSWTYEKPQIVVLTLEGGIVTGESGFSPLPIIGGKLIGSSSVVRAVERLKKDPRVKGVVLRINSPGGSALASELMWRAIRDLMEQKPVVVSMGSVAASGGYYISATGAKIVADRTTLTGSIGILGGKIVMKDFYEQKLGITSDTIKTHPHADVFSEWRPFTQREREGLRRVLRRGYETFLQRVSMGRGLSVDSVDAIGRGHIWSGTRAKDLGLVDRLGSVLDAIAWVKEIAQLPEAEVRLVTTQRRRMPFLGSLMAGNSDWKRPWISWTKDPVLYWLPPLEITP